MKILKVILTLLIIYSITFAQSDFETTQKFKAGLHQIDQLIKNAQSNDDLDAAQSKLDNLKNEFSQHKSLLDKSLYPDDFNKSIDKFANAIELRRGDFIQISELTTEVAGLKDQVSELNQYNTDLIRKIRTLERSSKKDARTIDSLKTLVKSLKASLRERDDLVFTMVDSLLAEFNNNPSNFEGDNSGNVANLDRKNVFHNIKNTVADNIKFLDVTVLTPDDFEEMKDQQQRFSKLWRQVGPKLVNIYMKKQDRTKEVEQINSYFREWNYRIDKQIWTSVNKLFKEKNLNLQNFDQGIGFTNNIVSFIEDEIKSVKLREREEVVNTYKLFADTLWYEKIKSDWMPLLLDNKLLSEAQKDTIESRIEKWKDTIDPDATPTWIYFAIGGVALIAIIFVIFQNRKAKPEVKA